MELDILRGELERLYSLEEMQSLSSNILGIEEDAVPSTSTSAAFARSLVEVCAETDRMDALADAMAAAHAEINPKIRDAMLHGLPRKDALEPSQSLGDFTVSQVLGKGPLAHTYQVRKDDTTYCLRVLRSDVGMDRRRVQRYLAYTRTVFGVDADAIGNKGFAEIINGRPVVGYEFQEAQSLAFRVKRSGALHLNEARGILLAVGEAVQALHARGLAHSNLKLENVLLWRADGEQKMLLVDGGADTLRRRARATGDVLGMVVTPKIAAPELHRGKRADVASDIYAFGVLMYEVLTGKAPFEAPTPVEVAFKHMHEAVTPASEAAPRGWVTKETDAYLAELLAKAATDRPQDMGEVCRSLLALGRKSMAPREGTISEEEVTNRIDALIGDPADAEAALALETAAEEGGDPKKIADAFAMAADMVEDEEADATETKKSLLYRAARLFESSVKDAAEAEVIYGRLVGLDSNDDIALRALEDLRRKAGKFDELVEMLLERSEAAESATDRAKALAKIGNLYANELEDKPQALVAYTQALLEEPDNDEYSDEVESLASNDAELWTEVLSSVAEDAGDEERPAEQRMSLLMRLGHWYGAKIGRPDLALQCYQTVVAGDPANDRALAGMADIYRTAQQWPELGTILLRQADLASTPSKGRDLRAEAGKLLDQKLNEPLRAKDIYEQILGEDPAHSGAIDALGAIYQRTADFPGLVRILKAQAEASTGRSKADAYVRIAEMYEVQLDDLKEAIHWFEAAIGLDESNLDALKGIDRVFNRTGRYKELLSNLERQLAVAATPRQKITLHERMAAIHDEEFLDHEAASQTYEAILGIDPAHENSLIALVRHYRALDRWEEVVSVYDRHLKVITDDGRRVELLMAKGRVLSEQIGSPERAMGAYEGVVEAKPDHGGALEALARLRETSGDANAALDAIEALAAKAQTPEAKAEQWLRAAKLLEARGDRDGAIERYKLALDADAGNAAATAGLRAAYSARGDAASAVELISREIEGSEGKLAKARLYGEMARLFRDRLKEAKKADEAARKALDLDPTAIDALMVLGDQAFEEKRYVEAGHHLESLAARYEALDKQDAIRVLVRFIDSLAQAGSTEKAMDSIDALLKLAGDQKEAVGRVAAVAFDHGTAKQAYDLNKRFVDSFGDELLGQEKAKALYRVGESARRLEKLDEALELLEDAADLDPNFVAPLDSLSEAYAGKQDWEAVIRVKHRGLDVAEGDARSDLLVEIGDLVASKLKDRTRAAKSYVAALEDRPDDRRLLTKLMQLYSEEKDWAKLVEVVVRLADFVSDSGQKAKYILTAAGICAKQLSDIEQAADYYGQVLELQPENTKAVVELIELQRNMGEWEKVEDSLKLLVKRTADQGDKTAEAKAWDELGHLYHRQLSQVADAVEAYEKAQALEPENEERNERLAELYADDPEAYLEKAVVSQTMLLKRNPHQPAPYKRLRALYTETKRADSAYCVCQALYVMNMAEPDEERFFKRMRPETAAAAQASMTEEDWVLRIRHPDADPLLTAIFTLVEGAVLQARAHSLEQLGYDPAYAVDLGTNPYPMAQTLFYACGVMGLSQPITFQNPNDPGGLSFIHAQTPGLQMGVAALAHEVPPQAAAFLCANQLAYFRPGFFIRHLVPTGTGLKAWLFAAIKLIAPQFPVSPEMAGQVEENINVLKQQLKGTSRDHLSSIVTKLLQGGGSLDLKRWVAGVDLTADRAGFIVAQDLEVSIEMIRATEEAAPGLGSRERLRELVTFSVSPEYFAMRESLGVTIDS